MLLTFKSRPFSSACRGRKERRQTHRKEHRRLWRVPRRRRGLLHPLTLHPRLPNDALEKAPFGHGLQDGDQSGLGLPRGGRWRSGVDSPGGGGRSAETESETVKEAEEDGPRVEAGCPGGPLGRHGHRRGRTCGPGHRLCVRHRQRATQILDPVRHGVPRRWVQVACNPAKGALGGQGLYDSPPLP